MDKIILKGMSFFAYHGVLAGEQEMGQRFEIDAEIFTDLKKGAFTDEIDDTVDYAKVYDEIKDEVVNNKFHLLEALAEAVAARILSNQVVEKVVLRVKKVHPPIAGTINFVAVEVCRGRRNK